MSGDVTLQALERLTRMPDSDNPADRIAGQLFYDVYFTGGNISGVTLSNITGLGDLAYLNTVDTSRIVNNAVTYAKIQQVSATDKVLGRSTAGAGNVEEIACTAAGRALIDDADASAQRATLGLGTIATQNANDITVSGGAINGTAIGASTPSTGAFTTSTATVSGSSAGTLTASSATSTNSNAGGTTIGLTCSGTGPNAVYGIQGQAISTNAGSVIFGGDFSSSIPASASDGISYGLNVRPLVGANANFTNLIGAAIVPSCGTSITGLNYYGLEVFGVGDTVTLSNCYGIYVAKAGGSGTTTGYGINIDNQGRSGITNSYGLFLNAQSGSTNNYVIYYNSGAFLVDQNGFARDAGRSASGSFSKTNNTLADVTGLTATLLAGKTYRFTATLYTISNIAGGVKTAIAGTATATSIIYEAEVYQSGVQIVPGTTRAAALTTAVGDVTAVTLATIVITGTIAVNAAGTLTVQFAQNATNGSASAVLSGSTFFVERI